MPGLDSGEEPEMNSLGKDASLSISLSWLIPRTFHALIFLKNATIIK
jgi:hypothetical protein